MQTSTTIRAIKVGILEDHTVIREMLASFLSDLDDFEVLFSTADPEEAYLSTRATLPEVAIVDVDLGLDSGFSFIERLRGLPQKPACLVFTASDSDVHIKRAIELKATGFVEKASSTDTFLYALRAVAAGRVCYPRELLARLTL